MGKESLDHTLLYSRIISILRKICNVFPYFSEQRLLNFMTRKGGARGRIKFHDEEGWGKGKGGCFYIILHKFYNSTINLLFFILPA